MRFFTTVALSLLLMFSAPGTYAQQAATPPGSISLTAEQNAALNEASQLNRTVVQLHGSRKFDEALPLARRALELRRSVFGDNHALVADAFANLAGLHFAKGESERAEAFFKQALSSYDNAKLSAMQARFSPTLLSGAPVKVTGTIHYNFVAPF